jgi:hypothetical protein
MHVPAGVDKDHNGLFSRVESGMGQEYVNVTVMLKNQPTTSIAKNFVSSGGYLIMPQWNEVIYGFGGKIP